MLWAILLSKLKCLGKLIQLYHHIIHPEKAGLYFVPLGALMPLSELQGKWIAGLIKGTIKKPAKTAMLKTID
ncbi:MAG: hypothetical protein AB8G86_04460, partial [Saprospiraceae bacterium]